jgi:hypothetical protein
MHPNKPGAAAYFRCREAQRRTPALAPRNKGTLGLLTYRRRDQSPPGLSALAPALPAPRCGGWGHLPQWWAAGLRL